MSNTARIHASKQPRRPHFIEAWAERRGLTQSDLSRELGVDKSIVSRWYAGASPSVKSQEMLAALFSCEIDGIFRHPDEDWMARLLRRLNQQEVERMKIALQAMFPARTGTDG
jgi:transcriptional regulator with XRE-family HTH domain